MIRQLIDHDWIPLEMRVYIQQTFNGSVSEFFIGKTDRDIQMHLHEDENETWMGGSGGAVILDNPRQPPRSHAMHLKQPPRGHVMHPNVFTTVLRGGSHGMKKDPSAHEILFLGIKFW